MNENKMTIFDKEARLKLLQGCEHIYKVVSTTYSPLGRNVAITRQWNYPIILHDGVICARESGHKDPFIRMGIDIIREAAQKQVIECGDGTSVVTILTYHLVEQGMKLLEQGVNPMRLRKELYSALEIVLKELQVIAKPIKGTDELKRVATISADSKELGELVVQAIDKVGQDGLVTVEESGALTTSVEYSQGFELRKGFISPYMVTNAQREEAALTRPAVVVTDKKITSNEEIVKIIEPLYQKGIKSICIIGEVSGIALATAIKNKLEGIMQLLIVEPPSYADRRQNALEDVALLTGATLISDSVGTSLKDFNTSLVGKADSIVASKSTTVIIGGAGNKDLLKERTEALRIRLADETNIFEREKISERLARLTQGAAVIKVGAKNEIALRERKERLIDAVGATKAAMAEGIVPGGAATFVKLASVLDKKTKGNKLLAEVLMEPLLKLLLNSGIDNAGVIVDTVLTGKPTHGYNQLTEKVEDLIKAGVIDPCKVIRVALENSVEVATSILSTDVLIATEPLKIEGE